jgi:hypothetical protein
MPSGQAPRHGPADAVVVALIGPIFLVTALWFLVGRTPDDIPVTRPVAVSSAEIDWPLRELMADPPTIQVAGFTKKCTECHSLFTSNPETPLRLNQHRNIVQAHGMNDRCFNCHDNLDRGRLVLSGGATIGFADAPRLCAGCHGTTYRDWQAGMHGRTVGSWDPASPQHTRLTCTECHDPHAPAFDPMMALPGPDTLRMGEQRVPVHDSQARRNPLRQWSGGGH